MISLYNDTIRLSFQEAGHRYQVSEKEGKGWSTPRKVIGVSTVLNVINKPSLMTWPMTEALKHVGGSLKYEKEKFVWYLDGEKVLTQEIIREAAKAYTKKSDTGKDVGKLIHSLIEQYLRNGKPEYAEDEVANKALDNFISWYEKQNAKALEIELVLYSKSLEYAGTTDALLEIDDKVILVDWKTNAVSSAAPNGVYPEAILQMGAYSLAYREENSKLLVNGEVKEVEPGGIIEYKGKPPKIERVGGQIDDLMVVNISKKDGKIRTLRASELGLTVQDCEKAFENLLAVYRFHNRNSNFIKRRK